MTEDNFEEFLKKASQSYNAPPARTPRDDMWSAIQAQRAAGPRVVYGGGSLKAQTSARRFGSRIWMGVAAAAVLLLATGVGLGRWSARSNTSTVAIAVPSKSGVGPNVATREPETVPGGLHNSGTGRGFAPHEQRNAEYAFVAYTGDFGR